MTDSQVTGPRSEQELQQWMVTKVSELLETDAPEIDVQTPLTRYGVDSVKMVELAADLESYLGRKIDDDLLQDHPDIQSLAKHLAT